MRPYTIYVCVSRMTSGQIVREKPISMIRSKELLPWPERHIYRTKLGQPGGFDIQHLFRLFQRKIASRGAILSVSFVELRKDMSYGTSR